MGAGSAASAGLAAQDSAVLLPAGVDRSERRRGGGDEDARMGCDGGGDALAASQPGADQLVGVRTVDLGAGRTSGGAAGLAGNRQGAAWLVHGSVAVDQFSGGAVDVIDAATQQNRLQAASGL